MKYTFSVDAPNQQYITISVEANSKSSKTVVQFPTWRPGRYQLADFAKNVNNFSISDERGKTLAYEKIDKSSWEVNTSKVDKIQIKYKFYAAEINAGSTFLDESQLYVNPVNCCAYIKENENEEHEVELNIPSNWNYAGPLEFKKNTFFARNFDELADSPFICSSGLQYRTYEVKGTVFYLWFNGLIYPDWDKLIGDFKKFTEKQIEKFLEFPTEEYHFLFQVLPYTTYHGVEHKKCTVITLGPSYAVFNELYTELLGVSSHELYHTWNVKAIRPAEWFPYDFSRENYSKMGYLAEGVTTYMGDLMLFKSGVFDERQFFKELGAQFQKHFDNFGRFNYSVAESSWDTWLDGYEPGAPGRKVSIYTEGALLAFITDVLLLQATDNKRSLDNVMRHLYFDFAQQQKGVTEEDYKNAIENVAGTSFDWLFEDFYYGTKAYEGPLNDALDYIGLEIESKPSDDSVAARLGIKTANSNGKCIVKSLFPGSTSDLAGLMREDEILGINTVAIENNLNRWLDFFEDEQVELLVRRKSRLIRLVLPELNRTFYKKYRLKKMEALEPAQERAYEAWKN